MGSLNKIIWLSMVFLAHFSQYTNAEMLLLSVIFRHGDRAPDSGGLEAFPNDPYANFSFFPFGLGGLTNNGKLREFNLGVHLRENYGDFLGDTYIPDEVKARSTAVDRTKMSLQLVLGGIYTPAEPQQWNPYLDWQPIPTEYISTLDDTLMIPQECPKYLKVRESVEATEEFRERQAEFDDLMAFLTEKSGKNISNTNDMYYLYHALMAESSLDLELPAWTFDIFPYGKLRDGTILEYEVESYTPFMKRINGGMLLRKITDDMTAACVRELNPPRKLFLYSGHEFSVAAVLQALGVYFDHVPRYSSAVILELHEENYDHIVKVRYYRGYTLEGTDEVLDQVMKVPGCGEKCSLNQFKQVLRKTIAKDRDIPCNKRSLQSFLESGDSNLPIGLIKPLLDSIYREESLRYVLH